MARNFEQKPLQSEPVYSGKVITVTRDRIALPTGGQADRDVVHHHGAVVMLPVTADGLLLFVRQFRYAVGQSLLELPAGSLHPGEDPAACAQRELQEEVGFRAGRLRKLAEFYSAPGFCTELLHLYLAENLTPSQLPGDDDEDLETVPLTLTEALQRAVAGEFRDAKTLAGVLFYAHTAGQQPAGGGGLEPGERTAPDTVRDTAWLDLCGGDIDRLADPDDT